MIQNHGSQMMVLGFNYSMKAKCVQQRISYNYLSTYRNHEACN